MPSEQELAKRYHWFCTVGWKHPVLCDPRVIMDTATPEYVDQLIQDGMKRWPIRNEPVLPDYPEKSAA